MTVLKLAQPNVIEAPVLAIIISVENSKRPLLHDLRLQPCAVSIAPSIRGRLRPRLHGLQYASAPSVITFEATSIDGQWITFSLLPDPIL